MTASNIVPFRPCHAEDIDEERDETNVLRWVWIAVLLAGGVVAGVVVGVMTR
jgi:hypothetical protein